MNEITCALVIFARWEDVSVISRIASVFSFSSLEERQISNRIFVTFDENTHTRSIWSDLPRIYSMV